MGDVNIKRGRNGGFRKGLRCSIKGTQCERGYRDNCGRATKAVQEEAITIYTQTLLSVRIERARTKSEKERESVCALVTISSARLS